MVANFKRQLIISFSIIVVSIAAATAGLYYISGDIAAQVAKVQADRAQVNQQTGALGLLAGLKQQAPQAAIYESAIGKLLPTQDGLITFTSWVNTIAAAHQVSATVSFGSVPGLLAAGLGQANFSLDVNGPLDNIVAFLNDIEAKSPGFLLQISSFDMVTGGSGYRLTAQGNLFFRP